MTMNSVRRYIYNELYDTSSGCMYAGLLLDKYKIIIDNLSKVPSKLHPYMHFTDYVCNIIFSSKQIYYVNFQVEPAQVVEILRLTKMFLSHFEKYNEASMPNIFSGCKIIDILDSAKFCKRVIAYEKSTKDTFVAKVNTFLIQPTVLSFNFFLVLLLFRELLVYWIADGRTEEC